MTTTAAPSVDSGTTGADTERTCQRCETPAEGDEHRCRECKSFLPGNEAALKHGARRLASGRGTPVDRRRMVEIQEAVMEDLGGEDAVSEVLARLVEDFAFAVVLRDLLSAHLAAKGPLTKSGKRRAALDAWHRASGRVERLAREIGTERRPAPVPSLDEYMAAREAEGESR